MKDFSVERIVVSFHGSPVQLVSKVLALVLGLRQPILQRLKVRSQLRDLGRVESGRLFEARFTSGRFRSQQLLLQIFDDGLVILQHLGQDGNLILGKLASGDGQLVLVGIQDALVAITFLRNNLKVTMLDSDQTHPL